MPDTGRKHNNKGVTDSTSLYNYGQGLLKHIPDLKKHWRFTNVYARSLIEERKRELSQKGFQLTLHDCWEDDAAIVFEDFRYE